MLVCKGRQQHIMYIQFIPIYFQYRPYKVFELEVLANKWHDH